MIKSFVLYLGAIICNIRWGYSMDISLFFCQKRFLESAIVDRLSKIVKGEFLY